MPRIPTRQQTLEKRIGAASRLIVQHGMTDGAHHKQWVLDQVLRELWGSTYNASRALMLEADGNEWDEGIAP
jgi:hypothetical protein